MKEEERGITIAIHCKAACKFNHHDSLQLRREPFKYPYQIRGGKEHSRNKQSKRGKGTKQATKDPHNEH